MDPDSLCDRCTKPTAACVCDRIVAHANRTRVLVLQHPSEKRELLSTVPLLTLTLSNSIVRPGLSWASLSDALGERAEARDWVVLYRGSLPSDLSERQRERSVLRLDRSGREVQLRPGPRGIVVLDGTWQRAKTLWWRNPWLLRLGRIVLHPGEASIYGRLRKEPDRFALSTLEAVVEVLHAFGEDAAIRDDARKMMRTFAQRVRDKLPPPSAKTRRTSASGAGRARQSRPRAAPRSRGGGPLD